jgi:hypothetical protein
MVDWVIVIPTYDRVEIFKKKTLKVLKEYDIPVEKIYVFVANEEEKVKYEEGLEKDSVGHIIVGKKGLAEVRDFIFDYFPRDKPIVSFDDDVRGFVEWVNKKKYQRLTSLKDMIDRGFEECKKHKANFWGVYPIPNALFMKPGVTSDLKFIIGSFWGCFNPGADIRLSKENGGMGTEKEDYTRTILFWERDKAVVRINDVALLTTTYGTPGGLQIGDRAGRERKTVKLMLKKWPEYLKQNLSRKSDYPELRLLRQTRKN